MNQWLRQESRPAWPQEACARGIVCRGSDTLVLSGGGGGLSPGRTGCNPPACGQTTINLLTWQLRLVFRINISIKLVLRGCWRHTGDMPGQNGNVQGTQGIYQVHKGKQEAHWQPIRETHGARTRLPSIIQEEQKNFSKKIAFSGDRIQERWWSTLMPSLQF